MRGEGGEGVNSNTCRKDPKKDRTVKRCGRHSGEGRNPEVTYSWTPAFAGVTALD
jgi:hypothetical protein